MSTEKKTYCIILTIAIREIVHVRIRNLKYTPNMNFQQDYHCLKIVQIRNFFWLVFIRIRTGYGEIRSISPYSVRMRENTDQ